MSKKPDYRLQPVLQMRDRAKEAAYKAQKEAEKNLEFERQKLVKLQEMRAQVDQKKAACTQQFYDNMLKPGVNISAESFAHDRYQEVLDKEALAHDTAIAAQKVAIQKAERKVEEAKAAFLQATVDLKAMEKHKEGWEHQVKVEELEKEQETQEELGEVMWLKARRDAQLRTSGDE